MANTFISKRNTLDFLFGGSTEEVSLNRDEYKKVDLKMWSVITNQKILHRWLQVSNTPTRWRSG